VARKQVDGSSAVCQPERAVQLILPLLFVHQAFRLEPFEVGQAQGGEPERLQEFPRRQASGAPA
jgi:hypothetical protein